MTEVIKFYRRPPIVERIAILHAEMDEELFVSRQQSWEDKVKEEFPVDESISRWEVTAQQDEDGLPIWSTLKPKLHIIPRFANIPKSDGFDWSLRSPRGELVLNLLSSPDEGEKKRYDVLRNRFEYWSNAWLAHFEVKKVINVQLHYFNALTPKTVPTFYDRKDGGLMLSEIVHPFADIPGDYHSIVPPYSCEINLRADPEGTCILKIKVYDVKTDRVGNGLGINFEARIHVDNHPEHISSGSIMELLDRCHGHIISQFEAIFTDRAKESFEPQS